MNKLLMDTATAEYLFCCDFFQEDTIFSELFSTTLAVVEGSLAASIQVPFIECLFSYPWTLQGCCRVLRNLAPCSANSWQTILGLWTLSTAQHRIAEQWLRASPHAEDSLLLPPTVPVRGRLNAKSRPCSWPSLIQGLIG